MANNGDFNNNNFNSPSAGPDDHEFKEGPSILEAWNNSPILKIMTIGAVVVILFVGYLVFSGGEEIENPSALKSASEVNEAPGTEVDPAYEEALKEADRQRFEEALNQNKSVLPTPRGALTDRTGNLFEADKTPAQEEDPLERWRRQAEEREKQREELRRQNSTFNAAKQQQANQNQQNRKEDDGSALAGAMAAQMKTILDARDIKGAQILQVTSKDDMPPPSLTDAAPTTEELDVETIIVPAGEIYFGQLITEARSDVKAPIMAEIHSGPLRGAKALGSFQKTEGNKLVLTFDKIVVEGIDYPVDAVAVDPSTRNAGLVTDVDYHLLTRVILPGAAAFIEGIASAYAERENTVTVTGDVIVDDREPLNARGKIATGVEAASEEVGDFLDEEADRVSEPTVTVASGTPLGILFVSPVVSQE